MLNHANKLYFSNTTLIFPLGKKLTSFLVFVVNFWLLHRKFRHETFLRHVKATNVSYFFENWFHVEPCNLLKYAWGDGSEDCHVCVLSSSSLSSTFNVEHDETHIFGNLIFSPTAAVNVHLRTLHKLCFEADVCTPFYSAMTLHDSGSGLFLLSQLHN